MNNACTENIIQKLHEYQMISTKHVQCVYLGLQYKPLVALQTHQLPALAFRSQLS